MKGGKREGAGRPILPYKTKIMRVPEECIDRIKAVIEAFKKEIKLLK